MAPSEKPLTNKEINLLSACEHATWAIEDWQNGQELNLEPIINRLSISAANYAIWELPRDDRCASFLDIVADPRGFLRTAQMIVARTRSQRRMPTRT